jgi:hypothetical protein
MACSPMLRILIPIGLLQGSRSTAGARTPV